MKSFASFPPVLVFLASCTGTSVSSRIEPGEPCLIEHLTQREGAVHRLVVVNRSLASRLPAPSTGNRPVRSTVRDSEMALMITELDRLGFFAKAKTEAPPIQGSLLHVRIGKRDYYLNSVQACDSDEGRRRWIQMIGNFGQLYNVGDTAFGIATKGGKRIYDPLRERARIERRNARKKRALHRGPDSNSRKRP